MTLTVGQLIARLSEFPPDAEVVTLEAGRECWHLPVTAIRDAELMKGYTCYSPGWPSAERRVCVVLETGRLSVPGAKESEAGATGA